MNKWISQIGMGVCFAITGQVLTAATLVANDGATSYQRDVPGLGIVKFELLNREQGGRVSWYKGYEHQRIAYDSEVSPGRTEVFTVNPDGTGKRCVTCQSATLNLARNLSGSDHYGEYVGQPEWYPLGGNTLLIQVENEYSSHSFLEHMSWGINHDLWMLREDGTQAQKVYDTPQDHAALHPHFNTLGTGLMFASKLPSWSPWNHWNIHLAKVDISQIGQHRLTNHLALEPAGEGFYETHGFTGEKQGLMTFTYTPSVDKGYVQDGYASTIFGTHLTMLTNEPSTWTEHTTFSPSMASFAYNSSSPFTWKPEDGWASLRMELMLKKDDVSYQLSNMNEARKPGLYQYVVSDFDWDRTSKRIVFQVQVNAIGGKPLWTENWIATLASAQ